MITRKFLVGLAATLVAGAVILVLPLFLSDTHEYRFAFVATFFIGLIIWGVVSMLLACRS